MEKSSVCPSMWIPALSEPPWHDDTASDEVCPSCGTHFGYDDCSGRRLGGAGACIWRSTASLDGRGLSVVLEVDEASRRDGILARRVRAVSEEERRRD
jgi:hypothetical protein